MRFRQLRASVAILAAAVCVLCLVTVPAARANGGGFVVTIDPANGTVLPDTTTTQTVSATITPAEGVSLPFGVYYGLGVFDITDMQAPSLVGEKWVPPFDVAPSPFMIYTDVPVEKGHNYMAGVGYAPTSSFDDPSFTPIGNASLFSVSNPVLATFTLPEVYDASGDLWCDVADTGVRVVEVSFDGTLLPDTTYAIVWSAPGGDTVLASYANGATPDLAGADLTGSFNCGAAGLGDYALKALEGDTVLTEMGVHVAVRPDFEPLNDPSPNPLVIPVRGKAMITQTIKILATGHLTLKIRTGGSNWDVDPPVYVRDFGWVKPGKRVLTWNGVPAGAKKAVTEDYYWCVMLTNDHWLTDGENWPISVVKA